MPDYSRGLLAFETNGHISVLVTLAKIEDGRYQHTVQGDVTETTANDGICQTAIVCNDILAFSGKSLDAENKTAQSTPLEKRTRLGWRRLPENERNHKT